MRSQQEIRCAVYIKSLLGEHGNILYNTYFPWLVNPRTGCKMEIDIWLSQFGVAVEYQGAYHLRAIPGKRNDFDKVKAKDHVKHEILKHRGYIHLELFENDITKFEDFRRAFVERLGASLEEYSEDTKTYQRGQLLLDIADTGNIPPCAWAIKRVGGKYKVMLQGVSWDVQRGAVVVKGGETEDEDEP